MGRLCRARDSRRPGPGRSASRVRSPAPTCRSRYRRVVRAVVGVRCDAEASVFARAQQRREARRGVKPGSAPPVDRAGTRNERGRAPIAQQCVVLERCRFFRPAVDHVLTVVRERVASCADGNATDRRGRRRQRHQGGGGRPDHGRRVGPHPRRDAATRDPRRRCRDDRRARRASFRTTVRSDARYRPWCINGVVHTAAHIDPSWIGTHAATLLSRATDRPCIVLNDADAAGVAESRFGAARGHRGRRRHGDDRYGRGHGITQRRRARTQLRTRPRLHRPQRRR